MCKPNVCVLVPVHAKSYSLDSARFARAMLEVNCLVCRLSKTCGPRFNCSNFRHFAYILFDPI